MNKIKHFSSILLLSVLFTFVSCGGGEGELRETTTRGNIRIGSDDSFRLLTDAEIFTFETTYPYAKVRPTFGSEAEMIDLFMKDSLRAIIISRELTSDEKSLLESQSFRPKQTLIANDGVAFIINKANVDSNLSYAALTSLFSGNASSWLDLGFANRSDSVRVVFDDPRSGNARFLKEYFQIDELPSNCYALKNNEEVVKYVEEHPSAIGVIGSNWISDPQDTVSVKFLSQITVAGVSGKDNPGLFRKPYQAYIANEEYPFRRPVFYINREVGTRLATGFASFIAGDKGQRIVLKSGLVPATVPIRMVETKSE
jgi:phosphate transport system substrate-binding protein